MIPPEDGGPFRRVLPLGLHHASWGAIGVPPSLDRRECKLSSVLSDSHSLAATPLLHIPVNKQNCLPHAAFVTAKGGRPVACWGSFGHRGQREDLSDPGVTFDSLHWVAVTVWSHVISSCFSLIPGEGRTL